MGALCILHHTLSNAFCIIMRGRHKKGPREGGRVNLSLFGWIAPTSVLVTKICGNRDAYGFGGILAGGKPSAKTRDT